MIAALIPVFIKHQPEEIAMGSLQEENTIARSMGLTYGKYKALMYEKERKTAVPPLPLPKPTKSRRRYTDEEAFAMWQAGMNDCEIGARLGVSRQIIQRWRDTMELPSTAKSDIDTGKYRLVKTTKGMFVICGEEQ